MVAAAVGGLRTIVDHGRTGFLVEGRRPEAYAAWVAKILDDTGLAAQLARQARERATGYTWSTAAARLRRLYGDLTARQLVRC